ncbi:MAG TPA: N,N-dimethylformamidase beta subunit family domain-containing protein, partial [Chitinophagaceae bacterium]
MRSGFMYSTPLRKRLLITLAALSCLSFSIAQNPIVTENALTGNPASEWDIAGAGDLSIQGFATDISVNKGQTVHFKIKTDASAYTIDIYRLGYYNGNGARKVGTGTITATLPQTQPDPLTDAVTGLVDCGNWNESANWAVPSTAVSGIYIAKLTRTDDNGASHIVFIVRDDASNSDLFFQASDATWQAYNAYGGGSLYTGATSLPAGHASKVSYNRPFLTRAGGGGGGANEDWIFNAEYPMIRFLEKNGYNVTYTTNIDAARFGSLILNHKVFLSVGHDEYWSAEQRANVEAARNAGVHLAFFSGNEVYWKTRWENSTDVSNTPYRTLVCYKEGTLGENVCGSKCDPTSIWTGLWRDGAAYDAGLPENALSGQIGWEHSSGAIEVPSDYKDLRFWRNTSIASLGSGNIATLPDGTLGYEWNFEQYPNSYPAGRITLSSTTVNGNTHKLSLYRHSSGALVFGAGTIQWSWGLDDQHDGGNLPPSQDMQQATVNLFADMGVQPATLQAGLTPATQSTDILAPVAGITSLAHNASVVINTPVIISGTANDISSGGTVAGVEISIDGGPWTTVTGTTNWSYSWTPVLAGSVSVRIRGFDDSGNMGQPGTTGSPNNITVHVTGALPNSFTIFQPSDVPINTTANDGGQAIEVGTKFRVTVNGNITGFRYYKGAGTAGTRTGHLWSSTGTQLAEAVFTNETASGWQEVLLTTPVAVVIGTTYVVSYHSTSGDYVITNPYFTQAVVNGPLRGLANGEDGPNGLYIYSPGFAFPVNNFQTSNYWADVVFQPDGGFDVTPPEVLSVSPANASTAISINTSVSATFNEDIDPNTVTSSSFELRNAANVLVPASVIYTAGTRTATLTPLSSLLYAATYTATLKSGASGIKDIAGNAITTDYVWSFSTVSAPPISPTEGAGGPVLVISSATNPFSRYPVEILRAEGLNGFTATDISTLTAGLLNNYDVVVLGEVTVTPAQVTMLTDWVNAGGTLIAFKPNALLTPLLGLSTASGTLSDKYLLVNTASGPGTGIVSETMQYHGEANLHTLNGATAIATLYSDATTATTNPAVTSINVGTNGGKAVAFTYDLAKSIIYTRQGNPAWAGQKRDGTSGPIRSDDMFYPDWIDLDKVAIPQADEQQRLLANIIIQSSLHRKPMPRFWYLPRDLKAAIVMTGDDHAVNGTAGRFNQYITLGPNTPQDIAEWRAIRGTSYIYPNTPITDAEVASFQAQGFEIALHGSTGCANFTPTSLANDLDLELTAFTSAYPSALLPVTNRTHCMPWSDWASHAKVEASLGIRLDVNYYYWPGAWVQNRPGMFTGSGIPMRFADLDGTMIDCYQAPTQMTDESEIGVATFSDALLDKALGTEGYYGVFTANMHTDTANHIGSNAIIASALARNVPVISAKQLLTWLDGRNNSSFGTMTWSNNQLSFPITVYSGAVNLRAMLPVVSTGDGVLTSITRNSSPVPFIISTIKGIQYAFFDAAPGTNLYVATYIIDNTVPVITNVAAVPNANGTATITWNTSEPTNSRVDYGTLSGNLNQNSIDTNFVTSHSITLTGLAPLSVYYFRVISADLIHIVTEPVTANPPLSFSMPEFPCVNDQVTADFSQGAPGENTLVTAEGNGSVVLKPILNQDFSGSVVPSGWSSALFNPSGITTVNGGSITVNGAHAYSNNAFGPGTSIEFVATFNPGAFQNVGFTIDQEFNGSPWVTIGQGSQDGNLYARASDGSAINLGSTLFGSPHRYRINWNANDFQFFVDGNPVASATINMAVAANMYLQISDISHTDGSVSVDWLRAGPYAASGTYTSRVFNAGSPRPWGAIIWNSDIFAGTTLDISVRTGNTPVPDGTWSAFTPIATSGTTVGGNSQYIQYKADLATTNTGITPTLKDVLIECSAPPAITLHPSAQTVCDGANVSFSSSAIGFPVPTVQWEVSTNGTVWEPINGATNNTLTFAATATDNNKQYRAVWSNGFAILNSDPALLTVNLIPTAPVVTVENNCGNSALTATNFTGSLTWSNTATTPSITVTDAALYSVTQTLNGCISPAGSGTSLPKTVPSAPTVSVVNNCGNSLLTAGNYSGTLLWSTGTTTESTSVSFPGTYTITQTVNGCTSPNGSGLANPKEIPAAPTVTVVNNCGNSVLTASDFSGSLLWSTGETTSSITVTNAAAHTVTQSINGCIGSAGNGISAPKSFPAAPTVTIQNNCGNSVLAASDFTGSLLWSTGEITSSITVSNAASYSVAQTVEGCTGNPGNGTSAPKPIPGAPTVSVVNNCGNSVLTAANYTGTLLWNTGAITPSITV